MRYCKFLDADGNLTAIGTGAGGVEITAEEYAALSDEIAEKAVLVAKLASTDLEIILAGMGVSANMTGANMVTPDSGRAGR